MKLQERRAGYAENVGVFDGFLVVALNVVIIPSILREPQGGYRVMLRKLFPGGFSNSPYNSFKLVLVAGGYLANEIACFIGDCVDLIEAFFSAVPFGLTRMYPGWLNMVSVVDLNNTELDTNNGPTLSLRSTSVSLGGKLWP